MPEENRNSIPSLENPQQTTVSPELPQDGSKESIPSQSNKKRKIFIVILIILGVIVTGVILTVWIMRPTHLTYDSNSLTAKFLDGNEKEITPTVAPTLIHPSPPVSTAYPDKIPLPPVTGWKTYKFPYGGYQLDYPEHWYVSDCPSGGGMWNCININVMDKTHDEKKFSMDGMLTVGTGDSNYDKPADIIKQFSMYGLTYRIKVDTEAFKAHGYFTNGIDEILQKMVDSIKPLNEVSTCDAPALVPLKSFPDNFSLSTYHNSDGTDPVETYWPYTIVNENNKPGELRDTYRGFMVNYIKDGNSFADSPAFSKTVTAIIGTENAEGGFEKNSTSIWHINCVDTQKDGPGVAQPYFVGSDNQNKNQLFSIALYGKAANPTLLWGRDKWNISLLKSTRDVVYIKQNNTWQKYVATGYFATAPTVYGGKPAIYLYPPITQKISVEIYPQGKLIKTDDLYSPLLNGWNIIADKNGKINKSFDYLYYEAMLTVPKPAGGYVIPYSKLFSFSRDYVKELGLTDNEADEFVAFWKTKLAKAPYYFVSNLDQETIAKIYPLTITPKPDTLLRVELYFKPLQEKINVLWPRKIETPKRNGFTAVEWGGIYSY